MKTSDKLQAREFDFALIVKGVESITPEVENALFEAGCDDGTVSMQYGLLYIEFSRVADSLEDAIITAIQNVQNAGIGAQVLRIDECNLVTSSEIARRIDRSRQLVHQYISGQRGPGNFPPPECQLIEGKPLWAWCSVSYWLVQNNLLRPEECQDAEVIEAVNVALAPVRFPQRLQDTIVEVMDRLNLPPARRRRTARKLRAKVHAGRQPHG